MKKREKRFARDASRTCRTRDLKSSPGDAFSLNESQLVSAARRSLAAPAPELAALRLRFRERMQCLLEPGANEKLGALMSGPMTLDSRVIAGASH